MTTTRPHYLLFSLTVVRKGVHSLTPTRYWRFVLEGLDGGDRMVAEDAEPHTSAGRLELLAVVRGLEALDEPSRVTLVTPSHYVSRGLRHGLNQWRRDRWRWERFGRWVPVRDHDLWRRVDRALQIHDVSCRVLLAEDVDGGHVADQPFDDVPTMVA